MRIHIRIYMNFFFFVKYIYIYYSTWLKKKDTRKRSIYKYDKKEKKHFLQKNEKLKEKYI